MNKFFFYTFYSLLIIINTLNASTISFSNTSKIDSEYNDENLSFLAEKNHNTLFYPGSLAILPQDGRQIYLEAFSSAKHEIRIEICVLEDPIILEGIQQALERGVNVRVIVDNGKYQSTPDEQINLATYLTSSGGQLHLSNPIFPRNFPKVILIDDHYVLIGSACLDSTTFAQYRDYAYVSNSHCTFKALSELFDNDWIYSAEVGRSFPIFNPTPPMHQRNLLISPVNSSSRLVSFIQNAKTTLDVTSELLGNPTLESELSAAISRGVRVRLIAPKFVNGATPEIQLLQITSLDTLKAAGLDIHVTLPPESQQFPYMHARTAIADGKIAYLGSISLSPDSITFNREAGILLEDKRAVDKLQKQFDIDYQSKSQPY